MKHARNIILLVLLLSPIFLTGLVVPLSSNEKQVQDVTPTKQMSVSYNEFPAIRISDDDMFRDMAENESWAGDGTVYEPYIIRDYNISSDGDCIFIANISIWFEITSCYLRTNSTARSGTAIVMENVSHATISNTLITNKEYGLVFTLCPDVVIDNCTIADIEQIGVDLIDCENAIVCYCDIYWTSYFGVYISYSNNVLIENNSIFQTDFFGIRLMYADSTVIQFNQIYSNLYDGIYMDYSQDVQILENELWDNGGGECEITVDHCPSVVIFGNILANNSFGTGLEIRWSNYANVTENEISGHSGYGFALLYSNQSTIERNVLFNNDFSGIYVLYSEWCVIEENLIYNNMFFSGPVIGMCGIDLTWVNNCSILGNEIFHNSLNGISVTHSEDITIIENHIYDSADHGIDIVYSSDGIIQNNNIHGNGYWPVYVNALCGIYFGDAHNWVVSGNQIWNNTPSGISLEGSWEVDIIDNDIFNNTDMGIYPASTDYISILENMIHHNGWAESSGYPSGILLDGSDYVLIQDNEIFNNNGHGVQIWGSNNTIVGNEVFDNTDVGIGCYESYSNYFSKNIVHHNDVGISIVNIDTNITENIVFDNSYGIIMDWSGDCWIVGNDFAWNDVNAIETNTFSDMVIMWYDNVTEVGNHWYPFSGTGSYDISNGSAVVNSDIYPTVSIHLESAAGINYEITETGNTLYWPAYALNPSHFQVLVGNFLYLDEEWDGGNIEFNIDGLIAGSHTVTLVIFHYSGHSINATTTVNVVDETPPEWIEIPDDITIYENEQLIYQVYATDPSGIGGFSVNSTLKFTIDGNGVLRNLTKLNPGVYGVSIIVWDSFDNSMHYVIQVTVLEAPTTPISTTTTPSHTVPPADLTPLILGIAAAGGAIFVIVIIIMMKKRPK